MNNTENKNGFLGFYESLTENEVLVLAAMGQNFFL